jgi:hypothetical protein
MKEEMRKMAEGKDKVYEQLIEKGIITREQLVEVVTKDLSLTRAEVKEMVDKYNELMSQSVPFSGGARLKPNNIKPNHAVGEVYKPNIHDPHENTDGRTRKQTHLLGCGQCGYWVHLDSLWVFICSLYSRSYFKG